MPYMKRRDFITLLGGAATWPLTARAQQAERGRRIGLLMGGFAESDPEGQTFAAAFREGYRSSGGRRAATSGSTLAGLRATRRRCNDSRRNSSPYSPT
jgi:hypothetical protein